MHTIVIRFGQGIATELRREALLALEMAFGVNTVDESAIHPGPKGSVIVSAVIHGLDTDLIRDQPELNHPESVKVAQEIAKIITFEDLRNLCVCVADKPAYRARLDLLQSAAA